MINLVLIPTNGKSHFRVESAAFVFKSLKSNTINFLRFTRTGKEAWTNGIMSVFAFLAWAYAFGGGLVAYLGWYDAPAASVVLVLFTLVSGAVVPVARPQRK